MTRKGSKIGIQWTIWTLLWAGISLGAAAQEIDRPWGVTALSSGDLIVMETDGRMLRVSPSGKVLAVLERNFRPFLPLDVTTAPRAQGDALWVNVRFRTPQGATFNEIREYSLDGGVIRRGWAAASDSFAGIAVDPQTDTVWLVEAASSEIHRLNADGLRSRKNVSRYRRLVRIPGSGILGALAYDAHGKNLFVADSLEGTVYSVPVDESPPTATRIASGLGEPQSLAVDHENRRLYVADVAGGRIWVLDLDDIDSGPRLFARPRQLRAPVDVTVAVGGILWIADPDANRLFALDSEGEMVRSFR